VQVADAFIFIVIHALPDSSGVEDFRAELETLQQPDESILHDDTF
jgi:hypothetical protein